MRAYLGTWITLLTLASASWAGTEIGNCIVYENALIGFKTRYPEAWNRIDLDSEVTFSEDKLDPNFVRISEGQLEESSIASLKVEMSARHTQCSQWKTLSDERGIECIEGSQGVRALLKPQDKYLEVIYGLPNDSDSGKEQVEVILESIELP